MSKLLLLLESNLLIQTFNIKKIEAPNCIKRFIIHFIDVRTLDS